MTDFPSFTAPLTPTIRKYLDIKVTNARSQPTLPRLTPTLEAKNIISSSTSVRHQPQRPVAHARSTSSSGVPAGGNANAANKPNQTLSLKRLGSDMPPPQYVPVRPAQPSSRSTSTSRTVDDRKRTASTSVKPGTRPGVQIGQPSLPSSIPSRPTSASSVDAPHRPRQQISAIPQEQSSGPRRVPIPEITSESDQKHSNQRQRVASVIVRSEPLVARSFPSDPKGIKSHNHTSAAVSKKTEPPTKLDSGSSNSVKLPLEKHSRPGGITQPTLSQISRAKATVKDKAPAGVSKATWGRPVPPKANNLSKHTSGRPVTQKTKEKPVSRSTSRSANNRSITPAQIPLPSSPTPLDDRSPSNGPTSSPLPPSSLDLLEAEDPSLNRPSHVSANITDEAGKVTDHCADVGTVGINTPVDSQLTVDTDDITTSQSNLLAPDISTGSTTPRMLMAPEHAAEYMTKTPISALLSSIERGFLFTPSSPLSPPQSYLESKIDTLPAPFPLHVEISDYKDCTKPSHPFIFGVGAVDVERRALGSRENLDI